MKKIILVRHGDDDRDGLTAHGRKQITELVNALSDKVEGKIFLACSPTERTVESAAILAEYFGVLANIDDVWVAAGNSADAYQFINQIGSDVETFIAVTHEPILESFPSYYADNALKVRLSRPTVPRGWAVVIDCEAMTMRLIRPKRI